jgi:hypothetical protein
MTTKNDIPEFSLNQLGFSYVGLPTQVMTCLRNVLHEDKNSKTRNTAHDTCKSAPNIRKKWPRYRKKYKKIKTGHGEKKI